MTIGDWASISVIMSFLSATVGWVLKLVVKSVIQKELSNLYDRMAPNFDAREKKYVDHLERYHVTTNRK